MRRSVSAARLVLLALYLVGGTWGLPVLDAVVYHSGEGGPARPHVEPAGGCGHADACALATPVSASTPAVDPGPATRARAPARRLPAGCPSRVPAFSLPTSQHQRAPPGQLS